MHIHVVEFIGTNVNCNTVFPFVHFKCAEILEISPSLQRSEWKTGGQAGVCKIPKCLKSSVNKLTFGNIHDFQRLTLCSFSVFNWVKYLFSLLSPPYLPTAAARAVINIEFIFSQCLRFAEYLKNIP